MRQPVTQERIPIATDHPVKAQCNRTAVMALSLFAGWQKGELVNGNFG